MDRNFKKKDVRKESERRSFPDKDGDRQIVAEI